MKIKLNNNLAKVPTRGSEYAAGYDLYSANEYNVEIEPGQTVLFDTGISIELPEGTFGAIYPRSGISIKRGLALANKVAVIDSDYRGSVIVALHNHSSETQTVEAGERIAQLVVQKYEPITFEVVNELSETIRGDKGLGSSGTC